MNKFHILLISTVLCYFSSMAFATNLNINPGTDQEVIYELDSNENFTIDPITGDVNAHITSNPLCDCPTNTPPITTSQSIQKLEISTEPMNTKISEGALNDKGAMVKVPIAIEGSMLLGLIDGLPKDSIESMIQDFSAYNLRVVAVTPKQNVIHVNFDMSKFNSPGNASRKNSWEYKIKKIASVVSTFTAHEYIEYAAPDLILSKQQTSSVHDVKSNSKLEKNQDWGISNIEADQLWNKPESQQGVLFGVIDVGFYPHENITYSKVKKNMPINNHGNHISSIACGEQRGDGGLKGVLPKCFVVPRVIDNYNSVEAREIDDIKLMFALSFVDIVTDLYEVINEINGVHVYNISIGYNWENFEINQESDSWEALKIISTGMGRRVVKLLKRAKENKKTIYSAAGNDSTDNILESRYGSPFNHGAFIAREENISDAGVVVQSHNIEGVRSNSSNINAHLSCPGTDILSAVAYDVHGNPSNNSYGLMSGTSMASPYCAAAHLLFSLFRPNYSHSEIVNCLIDSGEKTSEGVPMVKLNNALIQCDPKS